MKGRLLHMAAMATALTRRWRGASSNGITLSLYWFDTHRHAYAHTAHFFLSTYTHTRTRTTCTVAQMVNTGHYCPVSSQQSLPWRAYTAIDQIIRHANYSCANMYTLSSCTSTQRKKRRFYRTQCVHDPVSVRCIAGCSFFLSLPLVFCLFSSSVLSLCCRGETLSSL